MRRKRIKTSLSKKIFRRTAQGTAKANVLRYGARGGIRM